MWPLDPPICGSVLVEVIANTNKSHFLFPVTDRQPEEFAFHFLKNKVQLNLYFFACMGFTLVICLYALEN